LNTLSVQADTIKLRDGSAIQGTFLGGNTRQIDFITQAGKMESYPIQSVVSLSFSASTVSAPSNGGNAVQSAPAVKSRPAVILHSGTLLRVRTIDPIDVDVSKAGAKYQASLDDPVMVGGAVVIPRGADVVLQAVKVQQSGRMKGSDLIQLKINSIKVHGTSYPVVSSVAESKGGSEGKSTAKKTLGGAGLGAIIGGIAGGGKGAAIGAAAGGTGGAILSASGQQHLKIPAETRLEFTLQANLKVQ
jgi:outer membrane lipoprotein SlyB